MEMRRLEIDNSAEAAVKSGKWKNPGSSFYYKILNSFRILDESKDDEDNDKYDFDFRKVLKEAYLIAPVEKIKNSPYGITPYSQSGCKYPHHVIKNGKLVVSVPGIQAAYARAKQQGIFKGDVKSHIEKHYKELGLDMSTMTECVDPIQEEIDLNFDFIQKHIESTLGVKFVHDDVMMESVDDIVDKEQYIKETFDWMDEILYESDDAYNRKIDKENELDESDMEQFTESTDEEYDIPKEELDKIAKDPKSLSTWMKRNFQYDKSIATWRLKSPIEMLHSKKGNCHDQSLFTMYALSLMGYQTGQVFFIEFKEGSSEGGNTHSLTWYKDGNQVFWLENAWEPFAGIHGPYKDIYALKWDVFKCFCKDNDINSGKFDGIMFTRSMPYSSRKMRAKIGQSLGEYVENQPLQDNHKFYFFNRKEEEIKEAFDWMDQILYQSDEEYNASFVGSSLFEETDSLFDLSSTLELIDDDDLRFRQIATAEMGPHGKGYNLNLLMPTDPNFFGHDRNYKFFRNPNMDEILYEIDEENELDESDVEELDFEEKYSAIDATKSEWNEFWSLFERGELHKTKSQMINYYNQYLEYMESIGNSSSDEIANAHQYKEKIDEMRSDPEYDSWMRRMDLDDMLYAEHRLAQLKPISDEEFIEELLGNKAGMLALTDPDDTELIERYQNEIVYLVECKLNPSIKLDKDAINWEYMNLIRYGMDEAVNVDALRRQASNFIENHCSTEIIHYQDIALPYLLKSYTLYERTSTIPDVKYSYRMGIDVDTGKLVAIKFKLEPDKITKVGNAAGHMDAYLSKHPEERRQYEQLNQKLDQLKQAGNTDAAKKIEHQLKEFEDKVEANANNHKFLNKDGKVTTLVDTLKNVITRTGHIDFVSGDNEIVGIIYRDGKAYTMPNAKGKKVRMLPAQSEQVGEFLGRMRNYDPDLMQKFMRLNPLNYIPKNQDDDRVVSLTAAFADPKVQKLFISFVKQFQYQPEVYEIGKTCGPNKYQSTRVLWNNLLLYRKLGDTPQFRGPILDLEVKSINKFNPKTQKYDINYTGLGSPEFIKKESYESENLNTIIADIKNNIKKYEEAIQEYISTSSQFNIDLSSYLEADDQSEENDQVEDDDTPPNIDLGDEEIESDEPPTIDTDESESTEEDIPSEDEVQEDISDAPDIIEPTSLPKATDAQEENKNGVRRKKLYIAFIEWAKSYNQKNTFGSIFDKDAFDVTYPFVPHEMRYFYRLANPILCVLSGSLTFFQVSELRKLNANNPDMKDALIFAATENDYRVFSTRDKKVYVGVDKENGSGIAFTKCLADSFDLYIQNMIDQGDILNGPIASESDSNITDENNDSDKE